MTTYDEVISLTEQVLSDLTTRDLKLAIAESCTGGLISSLLTDLEGSSDVLQYSIVAYTQESKEEFLGVPTHVIHNHGTVSLECAKIMAEGVTIYEADIGLATTGVIGESLEGKLKGTVFIAIAY
ncbi:MAG: CinA family protein, partial [Candidatus Heimdallarchaeota archaeon]